MKTDNCTRYRETYRGDNIYLIVGEKRVDISMRDCDKFLTVTGLELVARLITELLHSGKGLEELAGICFECSMQKTDLPGILCNTLTTEVDKNGKK